MNAARDFEDDEREFGGGAIRAALDAARWPWPEGPISIKDDVTGPTITATPFSWRDPASIPRRRFLYGYELRRQQLSAVVAPGAAGKTTLKVGRALCMATGRDFLGHRVWDGPHRVWLWNLEDEMEEVEKTVHAFLKLWNLTPSDLDGRLFIDGADSASSRALKLAVEGPNGFVIQRPIAEALIDELKARRIDYLDVDPFVSSHSVDENDNGAIDAVSKEWVSIARAADCAISLAHHVRKPGGAEASAFDARGAVAMINAARSVLVLQRMSKEHAQEFQIPECDRRRYFSVVDDKNNKAPPPSRAEWYEFVGVGLGNGDDTGPEDNIGAIKRWEAPDTFGGVTARQLRHVQTLVDREPAKCRKHSKSQLWVGKLVGLVLDLNMDDPGDKRRVEKMVGTWCATGALRTVTRPNDKREMVEFVEVGVWAEVE